MDIKKIQIKLDKFSKNRDWDQFHTPKNLSMALSVEVSELLELFQWSNSGGLEEISNTKIRKEIEEEIADIFIYLIKILGKLDNPDIENIINKKIKKNEKKYPVEKSFGKSDKYNKL